MAPTRLDEYVPSYEIVDVQFGTKRYKLVTPVLMHISQIRRFKRFACVGIVVIQHEVYFLMFFRMFPVKPKPVQPSPATATKAAAKAVTKAATKATATKAAATDASSDRKKRKAQDSVQLNNPKAPLDNEQYAKFSVCLHQDWRPGQLATICVHGTLFNFLPDVSSKPGCTVVVLLKKSHIAAALHQHLQQQRQQQRATKRSRLEQ
jgi:hypothetical protein